MACLSENITAEQIAGTENLPPISGLVRQPNGEWTFYFQFDGQATLTDGRIIAIRRGVAARATEQIGRRPTRKPAA